MTKDQKIVGKKVRSLMKECEFPDLKTDLLFLKLKILNTCKMVRQKLKEEKGIDIPKSVEHIQWSTENRDDSPPSRGQESMKHVTFILKTTTMKTL